TNLLLDAMRTARLARIVNVSSVAHYQARRIDWEALRRPTEGLLGRREYCVSKLCNVLHARELARRLEATNVHAYALHPGIVATHVWRNVPMPLRWILKRSMTTPEEGAKAVLHCAASDDAAKESGLYYDDSRPERPSQLAEDPELARALWIKSE